jgi:hypothetical protein
MKGLVHVKRFQLHLKGLAGACGVLHPKERSIAVFSEKVLEAVRRLRQEPR